MPTVEQKEWLSLQEASRRLGVSPGTLRTWADRGRVRSTRTPGGHRRFRERDLLALSEEPLPPNLQSLQVLAHAALGRTRFALDDGKPGNADWLKLFSPAAIEEHRRLGRRIVTALAENLTSPDPSPEIDLQAVALGKAYGELDRRHHIPLPDAVRAFLFFRDSFIESLMELKASSPGLDIVTLMRRTSRFVNKMLITMIEEVLGPDEAPRPIEGEGK